MDAVPVSHARRLRLAAVALVLLWFVVPGLRDWIPIWLPFLAFAALEVHFLVTGLREPRRPRRSRGRSPQEGDVEDLGGDEWLEPVLVEVDGREVWVPAGADDEDQEYEAYDDEDDGAGHEEPASPPARRRPRLARVEGVIALAALGLALLLFLPDRGWRGLDDAAQARTERLLSEEASRIAGHEARIRCDAKGEEVGIVQHADGVAEIGGTNAFLTPAICYRLHRLAFEDDEGAFSQTARAIAVLAHEAWHLRGERDEGVTNCYAFQSGVALGQRLGLSEGTAARMMRQQLADNATFARSAPEYLVPGECRNGGRLDLDPSGSRFP
jgi:hypothetical protein